MQPEHVKKHDDWNTFKKNLEDKELPKSLYFNPREVWYCSIGHNVGQEEDGKGSDFSRPVVIIKRFGPSLFIGVPLTSQVKTVPYYFGVGDIKGKAAMAMISQVRLFSAKRLINKIDTMPEPVFIAMKKAAKSFIF